MVNLVIRDALTFYVSKPSPKSSSTSLAKASNGSAAADDDTVKKPVVNLQPRFAAFLSAAACFGDEVETAAREELVGDLVILGHHPTICAFSTQRFDN